MTLEAGMKLGPYEYLVRLIVGKWTHSTDYTGSSMRLLIARHMLASAAAAIGQRGRKAMGTSGQGVIIAIHGVGAPKPGATIEDLSTLFPEVQYARKDLVIGGTHFARLVPEVEKSPDLLELNWSDVQRPPGSALSTLGWAVGLSLAIARTTLDFSAVRLRAGLLNAIFVEAILVWIVYPVLLGFMHANLPARSLSLGVADVVVFAAGVLTFLVVRKATRVARDAGLVALLALLGLEVFLWVRPGLTAIINPVVVRLYGMAQIAAAALIVLIGIEVATCLARRRITKYSAAARLAFGYTPLLWLSAIGACVWAISLRTVSLLRSDGKVDCKWQTMFLGNLGYDLKLVEWTMAAVTFALGCVVILAVVRYWTAKAAFRGKTARWGVWQLLVWAPVCLVVPGVMLALTSPYFGQMIHAQRDRNVMLIYQMSALRILPWFVCAVPGIKVLLDVLGDVGFYITSRDFGMSSFKTCNDRLEILLKYAAPKYAWLHVVAHSQGSVIAHTTLRGMTFSVPTGLTTLGSPLGTLYAKYLGWSLARPHCDWRNAYRSGDYVGGPVEMPHVDEPIGPGGHTGYWTDERITGLIRRTIP